MNMHRRIFLVVLFTCAMNVLAMPSPPAHEAHGPSATSGLGTLDFPTSTRSSQAQAAFVRGALLLHLFEYEDAAAAFVEAQKIDPDFVMAFWGEAMTHNHPLWNQLDETSGRAALQKLAATSSERAIKAPTAREKAYLTAVEILYSGSGTKVERDLRYATAMEKMASQFPDDDQAQLFYALALQGRSEGVRNVPDYLRAAEISKRIFAKNPLNPGAPHYWIHGMDDPEHASGAIEAARALSKIAPDAGHAQHMTSHIFIAMGLWDDLVQANEEAVRVVYAHNRATGKPVVQCFHYNEWLEYGYFQQGRHRAAAELLLACKRTGDAGLIAIKGKEGADKLADRLSYSVPTMRATAVIESTDWNGSAVNLSVLTTGKDYAAAVNLFANGYAAAQRADKKQAQQALDALTELVAVIQPDPESLQELDYLKILRDNLDGLIAAKRGDTEQALTLVRGAAKRLDGLAFDFGPPTTVKPPHELLGEILLAADRPAEAVVEFNLALKTAPSRALSLLGLARAHAASKNEAAAVAAYSGLVSIWHAADPDLAGLIEARSYLDKHASN